MVQLLWIELVIKLAGGLLLLAVPLTTIAVLGLPKAANAFWPRMLGAVLVGLAAATYVDTNVRLGHGLGLAGAFVIDLVSGLGLASLLFLKQGPDTWRGRAVVWVAAVGLIVLALAAIPYI